MTHEPLADIGETVQAAYGMGGGNTPLVVAVHEADGQDVTVLEETAYSLVTGGGQAGSGLPVRNDNRWSYLMAMDRDPLISVTDTEKVK